MINRLFPHRLRTPHIPLGIGLQDGLSILGSIGGDMIVDRDKEVLYRVNTTNFDVGFFVQDDFVSSTWYNDPAGRMVALGRTRKVRLYLERHGAIEHWEMRLDNGWMHYWFNEIDHLQMVYGIHKDVIRFNHYEPAIT